MVMPLVGKCFAVKLQLGAGGFGEVYLGTDVVSGEYVAIKTEPYHAEHPSLGKEAELYKKFASDAPVPMCHWHGSDMFGNNVYNVLVLDLMGPSLSRLLHFCGDRFNEKTVLMLAPQIIGCLEYLHGVGFIHGDVKPANFVMGLREGVQQVFIIDFGLAQAFKLVDPSTGSEEHIPNQEKCSWAGTSDYASINALMGGQQSRRDDLEAVAYMLIKFQQSWQKHDKENNGLLRSKIQPPEVLCQDLPSEFADYIRYCRELSFEGCPNYGFLKGLFQNLLAKKGYLPDSLFEWIDTPEFWDFQGTGDLSILSPLCFDDSEEDIAAIADRVHTTPFSTSVAPSVSPWMQQLETHSSPQSCHVPQHFPRCFQNGSSEHLQDMTDWFYENRQELQTTGAQKRRQRQSPWAALDAHYRRLSQ